MVSKSDKSKAEDGKAQPEKAMLPVFTGKRKRAIARAKFEPGKGVIKINGVPLEFIGNEIMRMKLSEPLTVAGDGWKGFNIRVNVTGGGLTGQADAARQVISKGLVHVLGAETKKRFMEYDRYMLVADPRRTEPHKPPRSSQGPRRYKQRSKR